MNTAHAVSYIQPGTFIKAMQNPKQAQVILYGAPMDYTVSFKVGSRFGPQGIRHASQGFEEYSPALGRRLSAVKFADIGDLVLPFGNVDKSLEVIYEATRDIVRRGQIPFMLGGEHLVTYASVRAVAEKYPDVVLLHFDAHTDLRNEFFGEAMSHATVIKHITKFVSPSHIYQFGIRSGEQDEFEYAAAHTNLTQDTVLEPLTRILPEITGRPIYVTLDIDVVDPAFAPGTGTQEPGGVSAMEMLQALRLLRGQNIVGMDLVEVSPPNDHAGITAALGAKLVREALLSFWHE
ncbi:agmatinase [Aneurinibacillus soli]|uniref:Agmatinase n=1 Tax=Aneurinibacillus soli TaxID=1500254 RepID=A0A0U5AZK7_9BACL|nr:agmatinase [Aneurinibacillus soli]BAU29169.1 Agmatinase [Aneurinibacillus soli]